MIGRPSGRIFLCLLFGIVIFAGAYAVTAGRLSAARQARRGDDFVRAERFLEACWPIPGMRNAIGLEEQLLSVQQGDLRNEKALQSRANTGRQMERQLILEALSKGNLANFQWDKAEICAQSILDRLPSDACAYWLRGRARVQMQRVDQAERDFELALKSKPDDFEIRRSLAELLHKQGHVRVAIEQYQRLLRRRSHDERVILALAHCLQEEALHGQARDLVDAFLTRHPNSIGGLVERGRLSIRSGDPEQAEHLLRNAVAVSPDHADANQVLRLALEAQEKIDAALDRHIAQNERHQAELKFRLREADDKPGSLTNVGAWMMRTGHVDEAAGWFYSALKEDSNYAPAHLGLMEYYDQLGQTLRAGSHAKLAGIGLTRQNRADFSSKDSTSEAGQTVVGEGIGPFPELGEATAEEVHRLCAACHAYPPPETMPRSAWRKEVKQGYEFLRDSPIAGDFPSLESVVLYYEHRASDRLSPIEPTIESAASSEPSPFKFEKRGTGWMPHLPPHPGIANANLTHLSNSNKLELLLCDTHLDALVLLKPYEGRPGGIVIPQVTAPCHTSALDLDHDGRKDVIVASLGSFFPTDDKVGKVLWLQATEGGQFVSKTILDGVGRVSDVQAADFNGDGRIDLIVAVFGWRKGGEILYLENRTTDWSDPQFTSHMVDTRHGTIHVPVADVNGDGRPDFIALISQQHESVVAYLNSDDGNFHPETIFTGPHPTFGCSGIEVVDLDGDRDLDVLLSNGDTLDPPYLLKPYHGVQWLENEGVFPYRRHSLLAMYGAARAVSADFDGDGDQDVAAVSFLPPLHFPTRERMNLPSVVLLEQKSKKQFATHVMETGTCDHFSCAAGDWDDDGSIDLAVANFSWNGSKPMRDGAVLWRNIGKK